MLDEERKRDFVLKAVLGAAFALGAARSPHDLVKSPGRAATENIIQMSRTINRRKMPKDLDLQRVSHSARNRLRTETYDDEMFRQHSQERPMSSQETTTRSSRTSSFLRKMNDLNLSEATKKKKKKKTFKEFVEEAYIIEAKEQPTFSSREDLVTHYGGSVPKGMVANNATSAENPKWRLVPAEKRKEQARRRSERIKSLSSPEERNRANAKKKKLNRAGLDAHHITPTHYSAKLKASMTDAEWEARVERDAEEGIYHGHHEKNLMGAVTDRTPPSRSKRGIRHHQGGAHELEGKTKDIAHVGHKGLLAAAHRQRLRREREDLVTH